MGWPKGKKRKGSSEIDVEVVEAKLARELGPAPVPKPTPTLSFAPTPVPTPAQDTITTIAPALMRKKYKAKIRYQKELEFEAASPEDVREAYRLAMGITSSDYPIEVTEIASV